MKKRLSNSYGFTIIEVMIVLAIAGLITGIVLLAVPSVQRGRRDAARKSYLSQALEAELEYIKNDGSVPHCNVGSCTAQQKQGIIRFITSYLPPGSDPSTGQSYTGTSTAFSSSGVSGVCSDNAIYTLPSKNIIYCGTVSGPEHSYVPPPGQIVISIGHYCLGHGPSQSGDGPLSGNDSDLNKIVVVMGLENGGYYCLDNTGQ